MDGLPFPDTGCPVPDVSIYYMSNINELPDELPDGILARGKT